MEEDVRGNGHMITVDESLASQGICNYWKLHKKIPLESAIALQTFSELKERGGNLAQA